MPLPEGQMTEMQKCFAFEFVIDLDGPSAAIRAGYSKHTAASQSSQLLALPKIQNEIERLKERAARVRRRDDKWLFDILAEIIDCAVVQCPKCWPKELQEMMGASTNPECSGCAGKGVRLEKTSDRINAAKLYGNYMGYEKNDQRIAAMVQVGITSNDPKELDEATLQAIAASGLGVQSGVSQLPAPVTLEGS